jgi:hypothetical protein
MHAHDHGFDRLRAGGLGTGSRTFSFVLPSLLLLSLLGVAACGPAAGPGEGGGQRTGAGADTELTIVPDIETRLAWYAPTEISADLSALSEEDRRVLDLLIQAAGFMDPVFLRQAWTGNPDLQHRVEELTGERAEAARAYYRINYGPWDRLENMEPFLDDFEHPEGAGFYPQDMTREEFETWIADHPEDREAFESTVTVIRRGDDGGLRAVPYSDEYAEWLEPSASKLREASAATSNESLRRFLTARADAFSSNDYYESDLAWMDVDAPLELTLGPYETYEDGLFGYKATFEAFVTVTLPEESAALERYKSELPWLERNLPIPDEHKNFDRGTESPIRVVDEVLTAGDGRPAVQTLAYNLPNDERVREEKGSKKVLLRNVMRAKYDQILLPIAQRNLAAEQVDDVSFDAYFSSVLHHELSHGLGPGRIVKDGRETEVRKELKELFSTIEEAKADVMGIYDILALMEKGAFPPELQETLRRTLEPSYVAGLFRAARFSLGEAHGRGVATQFNYLLERGALEVDDTGRFRTVPERFPDAIRDLLHDILMLQATGDYQGTAEFLDRYGVATDELKTAIARLDDVPRDIRPIYVDAGETGP